MAMTQDEICDFWKLGVSLQKVPEDSDNPQVLNARMQYEYLRDKMLAEIASQKETAEEEKAKMDVKTAEEEKAKMDVKTAVNYLDATLMLLATIASKIPQLASDPNVTQMIDNAKLASEWLHENLDSLKNPET